MKTRKSVALTASKITADVAVKRLGCLRQAEASELSKNTVKGRVQGWREEINSEIEVNQR